MPKPFIRPIERSPVPLSVDSDDDFDGDHDRDNTMFEGHIRDTVIEEDKEVEYLEFVMDGDKNDWVSRGGIQSASLDNLTEEEQAIRNMRRKELQSEHKIDLMRVANFSFHEKPNPHQTTRNM